MARAQPIQTNFTAGELSPRMRGRIDINRYSNGVARLENYIIMPQGGAYRRSGTRFVAELRDSSKVGRLVSFEFSTVQAYMLQFENLKIRFYKDQNPIVTTTATITGLTAANPGVVTAVAHGFANGDRVLIGSVLGMIQVNNREFIVANVTANTFELSGVNTTTYTAYTSGGTASKILEVTTTYTEAELPDLQFTQSADTLYICHQSHAPAILTRTSHTSWTLSNITFVDGPFMPAQSTITITPSGVTGAITLTASSALFAATDVGRQVRLRHSASWAYATITAFTSTTVVNATVGSTNTVAAASDEYRLGSFYSANYPACVVFHENRLVFGGTPVEPQTFWLSYSGKYYTYSPTDLGTTTVTDASAFYVTIVSNKVNAIRWMVSGTVLSIGTLGSEWVIRAGSLTEALTGTNYGITEQTPWGSNKVQAIRIGSAVLFLSRPGRKLREYQYSYQNDAFEARDISLLGEHLLRENGGKMTAMAYQQNPDSVVWMVRSDGGLVGMTYLKEQDIIGFHQHPIGGSFGSGDPIVESVAVIPNLTGDAEQLWIIVKRTIASGTVRYVEFLEDAFLPDDVDDKDSMFFLDAGLTYNSTATTTVSGLWHLRGETVGICADAAVAPDVTISSLGIATLANSASLIQLGLPYVSLIESLPPEGGNPYGTGQGKAKRVTKTTIRVLDSIFLESSVDGSTWNGIPFRSTDDTPGESPPLFTGDVPVDLEGDFGTEGVYFIRQTKPYPSTILALMPKYVVTET